MRRSTSILSFKRVIAPAALVFAGVLTACLSDNSAVTKLMSPADQALRQQTLSQAAAQALATQGLLWTTPRRAATSITRTVRREGGTIDFRGTGLQLQVPRGALSADMTFTITALAGSVVAYDFEPHGAVFRVPLIFVQDLDETNFGDIRLPRGFTPAWEGAYFTNSLLIDQSTGISVVQERFPANGAWTWRGQKEYGRISFPISHFSGYMISTGRAQDGPPPAP